MSYDGAVLCCVGEYPILEGKDDDASSVASDDSFVVVIPDCFDPCVPLLNQPPAASGLAPPPNAKQEAPMAEQKQCQSNVQEPTINLMTFDEPVAPPTQPACLLQDNSEPHPQEDAPVVTHKQISKVSPQRPPPLATPYQMISNPRTHILGKNPLQVGAAFIDSTMHHIDKRFGQPSGMYAKRPDAPPKMDSNPQKTEASKNDDAPATANNDTDDDEFQVQLITPFICYIINGVSVQDCTFDMLESAEPKPKPSRSVHFDTHDTVMSAAANFTTQSSQLYPKLPTYYATSTAAMAPVDNSRDVARLLNANSGPYQPPPPWTPKEPETPMQQLINLGFGNRELNAQLLHKHSNSIQAVVNELLDAQC